MGGIMSRPKAPPPPKPIKIEPIQVPEVKAPAPMPVADDQAAREARKKSLAAASQRSGRASTILTDQESNTMGGGY